MKPDFFKYLPTEIITYILLRLSVRTIAISKCVCKSWLHLLETDDFVSSHFAKSAPAIALTMRTENSNWLMLSELEEGRYDPLTRFAFPYEASTGGSANGLLFLFDFNRGYISYICNPITREFIALPCGRSFAMTCGFGVSRISGQHKVVSIELKCFGEASRFKCHVYTLGTGSWRLVEATDSFDWSPTLTGTFVRGNLHWMVSSDPDCIERVSCFDLETERFSSFTVPPLRGYNLSRRLYTLRDSLGFCDASANGCGVAIWMMKEYGDETSWKKVYVIGITPDRDRHKFKQFHPIKVYKNGDVLLWFQKTLFYYSKKTKTSREIAGGEELEYRGITSHLHTPTMLSLKCFSDVENVISF